MNYYKIFYWLTVSDNVKLIFAIVAIVGLVFTIILTIGVFMSGTNDVPNEYSEWQPITKRIYRASAILTFVFGLAWTLTPSKIDCLLIIAGGATGNFLTSDSSAKAIPSDITNFLHLNIQQQIAGLNSDAKKALGMQTQKEKLIDKVKDLSKEELIQFLSKDTTLVK